MQFEFLLWIIFTLKTMDCPGSGLTSDILGRRLFSVLIHVGDWILAVFYSVKLNVRSGNLLAFLLEPKL